MLPEKNKLVAKKITIRGIVQGVGFRPFIFRLAKEYGLYGWVRNNNEAVEIFVQGNEPKITEFIQQILTKRPVTSLITSLITTDSPAESLNDFIIEESADISNQATRISPDIAICTDCLSDIKIQYNRINYPFVNCCHCGPRFSIIRGVPYDRPNTTMDVFQMCNDCKKEYTDPFNRRFHAQPIACNTCGPTYTLWCRDVGNNQYKSYHQINEIIEILADGIMQGNIYAFKGMGGYNLVCDATNEAAVKKLRSIKKREGKPFAVMCRDLSAAKKYAEMVDELLLMSFQRPIVIMKARKPLAYSVTMGIRSIGIMLPYMAFHYMLFEKLSTDVLVMTSGNITDEPIIIDDQRALKTFGQITDGVLTYNREIYNRVDDSVIAVHQDEKIIIRRSRGYVPNSIDIYSPTEGIFAAGAELTGTFAIGKGTEIILSQYLGDIKKFENFNFYEEAYQHFCQMFRFKPQIVAYDMHPDYHSTHFANQLNLNGIAVQHHHAHIASVMAENNITNEILGIAFDGTGLGTDGNIWGGEFLVCSPASFQRLAHFEYIPLPGGDKVVDEPWRTAFSYLYKYFGSKCLEFDLPFLKIVPEKKLEAIITAIDKKINCPLSSSAGRLFDAVSVILNLCLEPTYHAEPAMRLEDIMDESFQFSPYSFSINENIISFAQMLENIIFDIQTRVPISVIAKRFHDTLIKVCLQVVIDCRNKYGMSQVAFSGGTFQNRYLHYQLKQKLKEQGFSVYHNQLVPPNDGGIALGQAFVCSHSMLIKK